MNEDKDEIASYYKLSGDELSDYLSILSNYRNLCAHEDILFCNRTQRSIDDTIYHRILNIDKTNDEYIYGKNDLFALIIILRQLLTHNEVKNLVIEISDVLDNLEYNLKSISIDKVLNEMGFPKNWKEIVDIER